jgi:hypothetical protein
VTPAGSMKGKGALYEILDCEFSENPVASSFRPIQLVTDTDLFRSLKDMPNWKGVGLWLMSSKACCFNVGTVNAVKRSFKTWR